VAGLWSVVFCAINIAKITGARADALALSLADPLHNKPLGPELFDAAFNWGDVIQGALPILYGGVLAAGVAYTLQAVAQKDAPPAHAVVIMSLETVFSGIGGVLLLAEPLGAAKLTGFILMFGGMLCTQLDVLMKRRN
jgi:drug/metabolite transporter (DMT)-like permease